jgi:hypothetical protein
LSSHAPAQDGVDEVSHGLFGLEELVVVVGHAGGGHDDAASPVLGDAVSD